MAFVERGSGESTLIESDRKTPKSRKTKQVKTLPSSEEQKELIKIQDEITQIVEQNKKIPKLRRPQYQKLGLEKFQLKCILLKKILDIKSLPEDSTSGEPTFRQRLESRLFRYRSFYESVDEATYLSVRVMAKFQPNLAQVAEEGTLLQELENWTHSHCCPIKDCPLCATAHLPTLVTISEEKAKTSFKQRLLSIFRRKSSTTKEKTQPDVNKEKPHRTFKQRLVNMLCCGRKEE